MTLKKNAYIETHENVTIEYETANLGSRFVASFLDNLIFYGAIALILITALILAYYDIFINTDVIIDFDKYNYVYAILLAIDFLFKYFYFVIFEMILKGQTPGKKAAGIKVVSTTGEPVNILSSMIRNFFRVVDSLPLGYLVGSIVVIFSKRSQRIGDIVANTMVIKAKKDVSFTNKLATMLQDEEAKEISMDELLEKYLGESVSEGTSKPTDTEESGSLLGPTISKEEYELLSGYLRQRNVLPDTNTMDIKLFNYFFRRVGAVIPEKMYYSHVFQFLNGVRNYNSQYYEL